MNRKTVGTAFLALGLAFVVLGAWGQKTYLGVGIVFILLGIAQRRQPDNP